MKLTLTQLCDDKQAFESLKNRILRYRDNFFVCVDTDWDERTLQLQPQVRENIQTDQYGRPYRITAETLSLPLAEYDYHVKQWIPNEQAREIDWGEDHTG